MTAWCMLFVRTKEVLNSKPSLWIEASTLEFTLSFELLAAESLSFVFSWNLLGTMSSLMQFKSAPVSKRAMASIAKSLEKIKVILIKYFLVVICFKTNRKSLGTDSMFSKFWSFLSSLSELDSLSELSCNCFCKRSWIVWESFFYFSFNSFISSLMSLISLWRSWILGVVFFVFILSKISVRS